MTSRKWVVVAGRAAVVLAAAALVAGCSDPGTTRARIAPHSNKHAESLEKIREDKGREGRKGGKGVKTLAAVQYEDRAFPRSDVSYSQTLATRTAFDAIARAHAPSSSWAEMGPRTPQVPGLETAEGRDTTNSGRVTAEAIAPTCVSGNCRLLVAAAGGGVWRTNNALANKPTWTPSTGIGSGAIGSLAIDPAHPSVVYAGTGEPNGSGDSEAGIGLYKSTDGGATFSVVAGSVDVSKNRSIGAVVVDPTNARHLYIGTDVARHGSSSVNGGRRTPADAPTLGLYESTNGGATWALTFSQPGNTTDPATGSDWFQGGVNDVELDPSSPATVYLTVFGYGAFKRAAGGSFTQMFATMNPTDTFGDRTEIAVTKKGGATRIYLADSSDDLGSADLFRSDDAGATFTQLSNPTNGTPGFASHNFCGEQCGYDMPIATPAGQPDTIWIGGQMGYDEVGLRSNGRAIQRSVDGGVSFTDMTEDSQNPPEAMHPDQHAIVFASGSPDIAFLGSDGGVIRTSGSFVDRSSRCDARGLAGPDLVDCHAWLSAVPSVLTSDNDGLRTIQFQSLSLNPKRVDDLQGGTQDNGTWWNLATSNWFEAVGGDGGQSGIGLDGIRMHTYYDASPDVNYTGDIGDWNWIADPLYNSAENRSFYIPVIADPTVAGSWFAGLQSVWRTQDNGGKRSFIQAHCNEYTGDFPKSRPCGDWAQLGGPAGDLTGVAYGADKAGQYVVATERAPGDSGTLWAGTRVGRVFISSNVDNGNAKKVSFTRIDTPATPERFVSGIQIDPSNANHAWVSFSGYNAYTPTQQGHVFEVTYSPASHSATWKDLSYNLGDQPILDVVRNDNNGTLYASTDFGVLSLPAGSTQWRLAATGLPPVAVYGLTISSSQHVLYAATHGRGAWKLKL